MDKNLKYLVLENLVHLEDQDVLQAIEAIEIKKYHDDLYGDNPSYGWFDCIPEIAKCYDDIPLSKAQLEKVEFLSGESCLVHSNIMPNWDGEGDEFDPVSLDGIEKVVNLKEIEFIDFTKVTDFSPLFKLPLKRLDEFAGLSDEIIVQLEKYGVKIE